MFHFKEREKHICLITILSFLFIGFFIQILFMVDLSLLGLGDNQMNIPPPKTSVTNPMWSFNTGGDVESVAISSDGNYIIAGTSNHKIFFFHRSNSTPLWNYTTGGNVRSVVISSNGKYVVTGDYDNNLYFFESNSSIPIWSYSAGTYPGTYIRSVDISSDGSMIVIAVGPPEKKISVFNKSSSVPMWNYTFVNPPNSIAVSDDSNYIAVDGGDFKLYLFNKSGSTPMWSSVSTGWTIGEIDISSDGTYIVAGGTKHKVYLFHRSNSTPLWVSSDIGASVSISANGNFIATGGDYTIYLYNKDSSAPAWSSPAGTSMYDYYTKLVRISSDGNYIVAGTREDCVFLFYRNSSNYLGKYDTGGTVNQVSISSNGSYIVAGSDDNKVYFFEKENFNTYEEPGLEIVFSENIILEKEFYTDLEKNHATGYYYDMHHVAKAIFNVKGYNDTSIHIQVLDEDFIDYTKVILRNRKNDSEVEFIIDPEEGITIHNYNEWLFKFYLKYKYTYLSCIVHSQTYCLDDEWITKTGITISREYDFVPDPSNPSIAFGNYFLIFMLIGLGVLYLRIHRSISQDN